MATVKIENPALPLWDHIPGGISVGSTIKIKGFFPSTMDSSRFTQINLCERTHEVIPLHLSIRFNKRVVVRNTYQGGCWNAEEKEGPFPLAMGREFLLQIVVQNNGYQISVNGQHAWTFPHRISYNRVTNLNIEGPVMIWNVEYINKNTSVQQETVMNNRRLTNNPFLPYFGNLPSNCAAASTIEIKGFFPQSIDMSSFTQINLCQQSPNTIGLHLSIRFNNRTAVRNSFRFGRWETEEVGGAFPFGLGQEFLLQVHVRLDAYQISVNGSHCWTFKHRLPFNMINAVNISGPVNIWFVDYINNKMQKKPQQTNVSPTPYPVSTLEPVYNPPVPFSYFINGGIKSGMRIYISGVPTANFQSFTIHFQCGRKQNPPPDIAFHFEVRRWNSTVMRNTRRQNCWEDEETAATHFPFFPSVSFDIIIMVLNNKYMVAVNGSHFIEYYHRMSRFGQINTLRIENDTRITSVRFQT